jgi:replicative DNA helicase
MAGEFDAAYESLIDPDEHVQAKDAFTWDADCQAELLAVLVHDRRFLAETAHLLHHKYFTYKVHQAVAKVLLDHYKKYKTSPNRNILKDEVLKNVKDEEKVLYGGVLLTLESKYTPGLEGRDYYRDRLVQFAQHQGVKTALGKILDQLEKGPNIDTGLLLGIFKEAVAVEARPDVGTDYFATIEARYTDQGQVTADDIFTTGLHSLDDSMNAGGMRRGEIHSVMAPPGVGKSLFLSGMALANVLRGKRVLFVSCEMNDLSISYRLDTMLSQVDQKSLRLRKDEVVARLAEVREGLAQDRPLVIKHYPSGTCDVATVRALVETLEHEGWKPDMLIVDYVGEMRLNKFLKKHEALEDLVSELCGLGGEKDVCVVTAMQPNREAAQAMDGGVIDAGMLGDSYGQLRPLHGFWTLNQSVAEKNQGVGRLWVEKARDGVAKLLIHVRYDPITMRITELSGSGYKGLMSDVKVGIDDLASARDFFGKRGRKKKQDELDDLFAEPLLN